MTHTPATARRFVTFLLAAALVVPASSGRADGTVSGKNSAAAAITEQTPLPNWPTDPLNDTLLTAMIARGKSRRMLIIQATLQYNGTDASVYGMVPTVNGHGVEPFSRSVAYCTNSLCDSTAGSWWLDLDAAEAANPGEFVGQPLLVRLIGGEISAAVPTDGVWNAGLAVQMVKK